MKKLALVLFVLPASVWAQASQPTKFASYYFDEAQKEKRIQFIEDNIYNQPRYPGQQPGCAELKRPQPPFTDVSKRAEEIIDLVNQKFSKAFSENPKIKEAFEKELREVAADKSCSEVDNVCRGKLMATSMFHYENLRPDMPGCKGYAKQDPMDNKNYDRHCELELKYRGEYLDTYSQGGLDARAEYTDQLVSSLNNVTDEILKKTLHKSLGFTKGTKKVPSIEVFAMDVPEICSKSPFVFNLRMNLYKEPFSALEPVKKEEEKPKLTPCVEEKISLYSEFVPLNFDEGRSEVGASQIDPVKNKIDAFILANPNMIITDISVSSNSSRTPYYKPGPSGKKVIDPDSDKRNLDLAEQRSSYAAKALNDLKSSNLELAKVNFETKFALAGPAFVAKDLNNRFVTKDSPDYEKKVMDIYTENKDLLEKEALIKSPDDLKDEKRFSNLYQVKYKPFQGFRINISGYKKETMKCGEKGAAKGKGDTTPSNSSKQ